MKFNKKTKNAIILLICILFIQMIFVSQALAQMKPALELPNPLNSKTFEDLVKSIATWFYRVMIPVASIVILYAAFLFMTSGGDEEKIKKAKRAITWAIVGIAIIIIGAGFITLIKSLLNAK